MAATLTGGLLACGAIAGPLFATVFLILGAARAGYDPLRHTVSSLAIGDLGWVQQVNFVIAGLLQRITIVIGFAWLTLLSLHLLRIAP